MEWVFNGKFRKNEEVYEFITDGIANIFLTVGADHSSYQIYYAGSCKEGIVDFSNCPYRKVEYSKEYVEEIFHNMIMQNYKREKRNLQAIETFINQKAKEPTDNTDYQIE